MMSYSRQGRAWHAGRGAAEAEILHDFSDLETEDIHACIAYASRYMDRPVLEVVRLMRFLVDAQLPSAFANWLAARGYEAKTVRDLGLWEANDAAIWSAAKNGEWIVITKDEDFVEFVLQVESGPQVVWLRIENCTNPTLFVWMEHLWVNVVRALESGRRVVEVRRPWQANKDIARQMAPPPNLRNPGWLVAVIV